MTKPNCPFAFGRKEMVMCFALLLLMVARGVTETDAISGKWGSDSRTLLDLKFDGTATVTGIAYFYMADNQSSPYTSSIRTGTFNPERGVLRLEGEFKGPNDAVVQYVIDGQVDQDTLTVKYVIGGNAGTLTMKKQ